MASSTETLSGTDVMALDDKYVMHTYARLPVVLARGEGCYVYDIDGRRYLDMVAGIAVNGLGHCPPVVVEAIRKQAGELMHTSNLYHTLLQPRLAKLLVDYSEMDRAFFCNSGAEANEAAMKLARKAAKLAGTGATEIVSAEQSFHGRTLAAITATGQPKYQKAFTPLPPGFRYVPYNDIRALREAVTPTTCALLLEPVQGESGVFAADPEYLAAAREACDRVGAALIFDEVQTGLGRTGRLFGWQHSGVKPDVMTLAKTLGGGFPIGACLARGRFAEVFEPGDHAATFGGNPLACAAAIAAVTEIAQGGWVENADRVGACLRESLAKMADVKEVRGLGLMVAVEFTRPKARSMATAALEKGLIVNPIGESVLRFVPPLILTEEQVDEAITILMSIG